MNNKANYKKGYKNEILQLTYICGMIPYRSLRLLADAPRLYQRAVKEMEQEGILIVDKKGGEKNLRLQDRRNNKIKYEPYIPKEYIEYYENVSREVLKRLGEENYMASKREMRNSSTKIMMYASGVEITPDKRDLQTEMIKESDVCYYNSPEIKTIIGYENEIEIVTERNGEKSRKINNTRINGLLVSPGGNYAVYNIGKEMIEWKRKGEIKIAATITNLIRKRHEKEYSITMQKEAVVIAQTPNQYIRIINNTNEKRIGKVNLINIDFTYDKMYAVPEDRHGVMLLKMMTQKGWRKKILDSIISEELQKASSRSNIDCDGYDEENDIYYLVFCIPDIAKLKNYIKRAQIEEDKSRFRIYCYTHQLPIIAAIAGDSVQVSKVDIEKYYKKYFQECNESPHSKRGS